MASPAKKLKLEHTVSQIEDIFRNPGLSHIGQEISRHLTPRHLARCRQVSSIWRDFIDTEYQDISQLKKDFVKISKYKARQTTIVGFHKSWKSVFDYIKNDANIGDVRIFIHFMLDYLKVFMAHGDYYYRDSPLTIAYHKKDFEALKVFLKSPNPLRLFKDQDRVERAPIDLSDGHLNFVLKHQEKVGLNVNPDDLLTFVIQNSWEFLDFDGDFMNQDERDKESKSLNEKFETLVNDVVKYCEFKKADFINQRRTGTNRKDGNTPLHYLQVNSSKDSFRHSPNCTAFSKASLRLIIQFYLDHGFDLYARNDHGRTPWEIKDEKAEHLLDYDGGDFTNLPIHYLEVLIEMGLK